MAEQTYYFDFSKKGLDLFGTGDVPVMTNEQAVKEAVMNLLMTEKGTVPMDPKRGVSLNRFIFEPLDDITGNLIKEEILTALTTFEERINNVSVDVKANENMNTYIINVSFEIIYNNSNQTIQVAFNKIR